jgi:hypothetical protein
MLYLGIHRDIYLGITGASTLASPEDIYLGITGTTT